MKLKSFILLTAMLLSSASSFAQKDNDFGADLSVEVEKKIKPGLNVSFEAEYRTQDDSKKTERIDLALGASYRIFQTRDKKFNIKLNGGLEYMRQYKLSETEAYNKQKDKYDYYDKTTGYELDIEDEAFNESLYNRTYKGYNVKSGTQTTDPYWRNRLRASAGASFSYKPNKRWTFSLKETMQYNRYFSADSVDRYRTYAETKYRYNDDDELYARPTENVENEYDAKYVEAKNRWVLRNKIGVEYNIKNLPLTPFFNADWGVGLTEKSLKQKYTVGMDFSIDKQNKLSMWYRYTHEHDDDDTNGHLVGLGYKLEF